MLLSWVCGNIQISSMSDRISDITVGTTRKECPITLQHISLYHMYAVGPVCRFVVQW
jgi:hypothetical protein